MRHHGFVGGHLAVEDVAWNLEVRRTRRAGEALPCRHGDHVGDALRRADACRKLGDRREDVDVGQVLQRTHLVLRQRTLPADVQHRALRAECGGDAGDGVGAAGAGGGDDAAEATRLPGVAVRGVRRHLLVAHVDDAYALVEAAVVNVDDVTAAQREHGVDALALESLGHEVSSRDQGAGTIFLGQRVRVGR